MATLVIKHYKKFKSVPEDTTPLHFAAMTGNAKMIYKLIQMGAHFNEIKATRVEKSCKLQQRKELSDEVLHSWIDSD